MKKEQERPKRRTKSGGWPMRLKIPSDARHPTYDQPKPSDRRLMGEGHDRIDVGWGYDR